MNHHLQPSLAKPFAPRHSCRGFASRLLRRLVADDSGVALVFTIAIFLFLFVLVLSVYSVGESIRRKEELQNACDAAAQSAAAIEADALSRMAVANRAMAWHYIQMTKEQMDYIVYRFLHEVRDRFKSDMQAVRRDNKFRWNASAAYYHLQEWSPFKTITKLAASPILCTPFMFEYRTGSRWNRKYYATFLQIECHNPNGSGVRSHADPSNPKVRFIGFGSSKHAIRLGYDDNSIVYYDDQDDDLHFPEGGEGLLAQLESAIDIDALRDSIDNHKKAIVALNVMYGEIGKAYYESVQETIPRVLAENLPHRPDGSRDPDVLRDYRWAAWIPKFTHPAEYHVLDEKGNPVEDEDASTPSFFTGLCNTEEDELLFLNMADGLPGIPSNPVILSDYFADESTRPNALSAAVSGKLFPLSAGLDQWFVRSVEADVRDSTSVSIDRAFPFLAEGGILRGYKNANYDEGAYNDVHRGNHVFHLPQNLLGEDSPISIGSLKGAISAFNFDMPDLLEKLFNGALRYIGIVFSDIFGDPLGISLDSLVNSLLGGIDKLLDVDPSCRNMREYFFDTCAHVNGTYGLVAEYEWHTAEWFCAYLTAWQRNRLFTNRIIGLKSSTKRAAPFACVHIPIPAGALFGAPNVTPPHTYGNHNPERMFREQIKGLLGPGHSRNEYRSTFINLSNEPFRLPHDPNTILKGYCRVYGDDIEIFRKHGSSANGGMPFDSAYVGVPAQPWLLNELYFSGAGTVVVALARRRANLFERLMQSTDAPGLVSAFSATDEIYDENDPKPWTEVSRSSKDRYLVALSAARASPAPRIGGHGAAGDDTVNRAGNFNGSPGYSAPPTHDVVFDYAAWRNLGPSGHPQLPGDPSDYKAPWTKDYLERTLRVGCPCGSEATHRRLDRQWNLSQTDWEPRLLPVRYALSAPKAFDSGAASPRTKSEWGVAAEYPPPGERSNIPGLVQILNNLPWHDFSGGADEHAADILEIGKGDTPSAWTELFRKRKVY